MKLTESGLRPFLLNVDLRESDLINNVKLLSHLYTNDRDQIDEFSWNRDLVSSYSLFYTPTNAVKLHFILDQLKNIHHEIFDDFEWIDFGCGPGTYTLALLDYFSEKRPKKIYLVDQEPLMLEQASSLINGLFPGEKDKIEELKSWGLRKKKAKRLLVFGNSFNEMPLDEFKHLLQTIHPDFIIFIEPGTPLVFEKMMKARSFLIEKGFDILYPCLDSSSDCPVLMRRKEGVMDWCHQILKTTHSDSIERIAQKVGLDRRTMPMTSHVYAREFRVNQGSENKARSTRYLGESKHSFKIEVCLPDEGELCINEFEIPKKTLSKEEVKSFKKFNVGEAFSYEIIKKVDLTKWRVKCFK